MIFRQINAKLGFQSWNGLRGDAPFASICMMRELRATKTAKHKF